MTARVILGQLLLGAAMVSPTVVAALLGQTPALSISGPAGAYSATQTLSAPGPVTLPSPWNGPAGPYTVTLIAPGPVTTTQTDTSVTISWGSVPVPPHPPQPPVTQVGDLFVVAVVDPTAPIAAEQKALVASTTVGSALVATSTTAKTLWTVADPASPAFGAWVADARKVGLPALLVLAVDAKNTGTLVEAIPLPANETAVIAEVKRLRGASKGRSK